MALGQTMATEPDDIQCRAVLNATKTFCHIKKGDSMNESPTDMGLKKTNVHNLPTSGKEVVYVEAIKLQQITVVKNIH